MDAGSRQPQGCVRVQIRMLLDSDNFLQIQILTDFQRHLRRIRIFTCRIARSASRRYLIYSEADFEGFHPHRCNNKDVGPQKLKFLLICDQNVEYKHPAGAYPLCDFHKICRVCTSFQDALGVKILLDLLKRL